MEQRGRRLDRRRLARAHDPVDVHQRFLLIGVLVDVERVADEGADIDVVDVEDREFLDLLLLQLGQQLGVELVAGFGEDLARLQVDDVLGDVAAGEVVGENSTSLRPLSASSRALARRDLLARLGDHFARLGIDEVRPRRHAAHLLGARTASSSRASLP